MTEIRLRAPLEAERVRLEPLAIRHAEALYRIYTEPDVARYLLSPARSREEFDTIFNRALDFEKSHGMWAVVSREDGAVVGRVGFFAFGERERPELAFLLSRSVWGRGIATEACGRAIEHALQERSWSEVVALVRPENLAASRVLEKLGFSDECSLTLNGLPVRLFQAARDSLRACRPMQQRG